MKSAMRNVKCVMRNSGVSLITVLLFMLVATIAATATYKWITSENRSSGSRMMLSEAHQASLAGLDNARSWITNHGNEAGALVKQFFDNGKKPVRLDGILHKIDNGKQDYSVWLVGVDDSKPTFKLKLVSTGKGRSGSRYSEISILKVDGLYRMQVPGEHGHATFEEAFYGNLNTAGTINVNSAIITQTPAVKNAGGQALNSISASDYLVLDGNFYSNAEATIKDLYITGDFGYCDNVTTTGDVYVGGIMYAPMANGVSIGGTAYLNGGLKLNTESPLKQACSGTIGGPITFAKNVTLNGALEYYDHNTSYTLTANQNLVANAGIDFPNTYPSSADKMILKHNVYVGGSSDGTGSIPQDQAARTTLGTTNADKIYINGFSYSTAGGGTYGVSNDGNIYTTVNGSWAIPSDEEVASWGASTLTKYAEKLVKDNDISCKVKQPIQFNEALRNSPLNHKGTSDATRMGCDASIWPTAGNWIGDDWVKKVNECYTIARQNSQLYNDKWLILETEDLNIGSGISEKLKQFIIWIHNQTSSSYTLYEIPSTEDNAEVVLFLPNGYPSTNGNACITTTSGKKYNYFIYANADVACMNMNGQIKGSIFMGNCSVVNTIGANPALNASTAGTTIISDMTGDAIICDFVKPVAGAAPVTPSCGASGGAGEGGEVVPVVGQNDSYYISVAPQLRVELESQYKNNEFNEDNLDNDDYTNISPSILVVPRIIYLTKDPIGKLGDYFSLLNLNGADEEKDVNQVNCNPALEKAERLYDPDGDPLTEGTYTCTYESKNNYNNVIFWVSVSGELGQVPEVSLDERSKEVTKLQPATVYLNVPEAARAQISVDISVTATPSNWTLTPVNATPRNDGSGLYTATVNTNASTPLFTVSVDETSATNTSMLFQLIQPCDGCIISTGHSVEEVYMTGYMTVKRDEASVYCNDSEHADDCEDQGITDKLDWPSCDGIIGDTRWIVPECLNRSTVTENSEWSCSIGFNETNYSIQLQGQALPDDFCEVLLPVGDDNKLPRNGEALSDNSEGTLYASIVRRKKTLYVGVNGANSPTITVQSNGLNPFDPTDPTAYESTVTCTAVTPTDYNRYYSCPVYVGDHIRLVLNRGATTKPFSYWKATGGDFSSSQTIYPDQEVFTLPVIHSDNSVIAYFNEVDDRCFYEDFKEFTENSAYAYMCASVNDQRCFYTCPEGACYASVSAVKADWRLIYSNYGDLDLSTYHEIQYKRNQNASATLTHTGAHAGLPTADDNFFALHRVEGGMDGTLSATFTTADYGATLANEKEGTYADVQSLNTGFVLRSSPDAQNYLTLNIFGNAKPVTIHGNSIPGKTMVAQVCEGSGQVVTSSESCIYGTFTLTDDQFTKLYNGCGKAYGVGYDEQACFNTNAKFTVSATIAAHTLNVSLAFNDNNSQSNLAASSGGSQLEMDLGQLPLGGLYGSGYVDNQRVGFKSASDNFRLYDITWKSDTYDEECWDYPHVMCSFKANYLGGIVPMDSNVVPWVAMSSYFGDNCTISYHYNGCDMSGDLWQYYGRPKECTGEPRANGGVPTGNGYFQIYNGVIGNGYSDWYSLGAQGTNVYKNNLTKLGTNYYHFTASGQHSIYYQNKLVGYQSETANGYYNSAYVIVECENTNLAMDFRTDNCNSFYVGDINQCTEDKILFSGSQHCTPSETCSPTLTEDESNLRDADLYISFANMIEGSSFNVWAEDKNGVKSSVVEVPYTSASGRKLISMDLLASAESFDPESVTDIHIQTNYNVTITSIETVCPYTTGIANCRAEYNGASWVLHSTIKKPENAKANGCEVTKLEGSGTNLPLTVDCPSDGEFTVSESGLYESVNLSGTSVDYQFKITITNKNDEEMFCETDVVTIEPMDIDCEVSAASVVQGAGVPDFKYSIQNCPPAGCPVTITGSFVTGNSTGTYTAEGSQETFNASSITSDINTSPAMNAGTGYSYTITSLGGQSCSATFDVIAKRDASASNCRIDGTDFKADITAPNFGTANATLHMTDVLGNLIGSSQTITTETTEYVESVADLISTPGTYVFVLSLDGTNEACSVTHIVDGKLSATCPTDAIPNQDVGETVSVYPVVTGCNAGCSWQILDGTTQKNSGSDYTSGTVTFADNSAVAGNTKQYTFSVTHSVSEETKTCNFNVAYRVPLTLSCPADWTGQDPTSGISFTPATITGCENNNCTWSITGGATASGDSYGGGAINFTHSNPVGLRQYTYNLTVTRGTGTEAESRDCSFKVTFAKTGSDLSLTCPTSWTDQDPAAQPISINPTRSGCDNGDCSWAISGGTTASGSELGNTGAISFSQANAEGRKDYTLTLSREGTYDATPCSFSVTYKSLGLECPADVTDQDPEESISITPTVSGCESNCTISISGGGLPSASTTSSYNNGAVSFSHTAGSGTKTYTMTLSRTGYVSKTCTFKVEYITNVGSATCAFDKIRNGQTYEWFQGLDKVKIDNPNSRDYHNLSWRTTWRANGAASESNISSGTLNCNNNSICEISIDGNTSSGQAQPGTWYVYLGGSSRPSCSMTLAEGSGLPAMSASNCGLNSGATQLAASQTARFDASLTKCNNSACNWYLKKNNTKIFEGTYGTSLQQNVTGPGTYTVHLLSESASAACTVTITEKSPASNCQHNSTSRTYGDNHQFQAKLTVASGTSYQILGPGGELIDEGTFSQTYDNQDWNSSQFHAKISGKYKLKIGGSEACETNNTLTVTQPTAENCRLEAETIPSGGSTKFHWDLKNCKNSQCSYMIKRGGNDFHGDDDVSEQNDRQVDVNTAGEYVVWLNDVETDCKKTLTIAAGGTLTCTYTGVNLVGELGQKIQVTSTRANGTYDVYLDGSIVRDSWNNLQSNISINKNETKDVGNFTVPAAGSHTWKITAHGSTTALCEGSFTSTNTPKVDCFFAKDNNGTQLITGSVTPNKQMHFCSSKAPVSKQVTLTGKKKDGDISENFNISKDNIVCYYFEAPTAENSYPFSLQYNSEEVCNTAPTLVVEKGPGIVCSSYTSEDHSTSNGNITISGTYTGCYSFKTTKNFSNVQINSDCVDSDILINGTNVHTRPYDGYYSGSMTSGDPIRVGVPSTCNVTSFYFW